MIRTLAAITALTSIAFAGPYEENKRQVYEYLGIKEPIPTTLPINCNGENTKGWHSGISAKSSVINIGDSTFTHAFNRYMSQTQVIASDLNIKGWLLAPMNADTSGGTYPCDVDLYPTSNGFWVDDGLIAPGGSWPSGAPTTNKGAGYGRVFRVTNGGSATNYIFSIAFNRAKLNLPTGNSNDFTCYMRYNKEGLTSDINMIAKRRTLEAGDVESVTGSDINFTLEAGTGIGVVPIFFNSGGGDNTVDDLEIGYRIGTSSSAPTTTDDRIEIIDFLFIQSTDPAATPNGKHIMSGSDGLVFCTMSASGRDASEMLTGISNASRDSLTELLSIVLGTGTTDSSNPVGSVNFFTGLNEDITNGFTAGLALHETEWLDVVEDFSGSATAPDFNYFSMYGYPSNYTRMETQANQLQAFCVGESQRAFFDVHGYFGGLNPSDVSGTDPLGGTYATFTMDGSELHTSDGTSAANMLQVLMDICDPDNLEEGACTAIATTSSNRPRDRSRDR